MTGESPKRRVRCAAPLPLVRRLVLTDADFALFEAIARHGPLPSSYLYEFTRHLRRDRTHLQNRLTEFYNGDSGGNYLMRPPQQFASYEARYQHVVYDLAPRARQLLVERDGSLSPLPKRADPFVHRLMTACVSASFELAAAAEGLRYISLNEIVGRAGGTAARHGEELLALPGPSTVVPDLLFGLEYPGSGFRFFAVECDRNTESIERRNLRQSAFARKVRGYAAALNAQTYRDRWGIPNLHVLTVTTSALHAENIIRYISTQLSASWHAAFGIAVAPEFGANWRVPKVPLSFLITSPWRTVGGSKDISKA